MMLVMVTLLMIERVMIVVDMGGYDVAIHLTNSASSSCRDPSLSSRLVIVGNDQQQNWRLFTYFSLTLDCIIIDLTSEGHNPR